ncbi:DUF1565 domain-containing protein, partial [bacterium]|nr:DUF1565 domain-containing protein [bacterium]
MKTIKFLAIFMFALLIACGGGNSGIYDYPDDEGSSGQSDDDKEPVSDKDEETTDADTEESDGDAEDRDDGDTEKDDADTDTDTTDRDADSQTDDTDPAGDDDPDTAPDGDGDTSDSDGDMEDDEDWEEIPDLEPDLGTAVYVDKYNGDDSNNGTMTAPVKTIDKAIQLSNALERNLIVIAWGVFDNVPTLKSGVSIYGGYSNNNGIWAESEELPVIHAPASGWKLNSLQRITLSKIKIAATGDPNPSGSSVGLILNKCKDITLSHIEIVTADGSDGIDGDNGENGANGGNGGNGIQGCEESTALFCVHHCDPIPSGAAGGTSTCGANGGKG